MRFLHWQVTKYILKEDSFLEINSTTANGKQIIDAGVFSIQCSHLLICCDPTVGPFVENSWSLNNCGFYNNLKQSKLRNVHNH